MTSNKDLLPVSEDVLGAYLEGTLSPEEAARVEQLAQSNGALSELIEIVHEIDASIDASDSIYDEYPHFDETFRLPDIPLSIEIDDDDTTPIDVADVVDDDVSLDIVGETTASIDDIDIFDAEDFVDGF